jgi:hypothetical protein
MQTYYSNSGCEYTILSKDKKDCIIQFTKTGSVRRANIDNIKVGKVRDLYATSCYGVGYLGVYKRTGYHVQANQLWRNMIKRCYTDDPRGYKSKKTTVDPRWHCLSNFIDDLPKLKNFNRWLANENYQLDKDLLVPGSNVYSLETCQFISEAENKSAGKKNKKLIDGQWVTATV